ncbi:MAG: hypothetical protein IJ882_07385, partial [Paludibacteraceae bacterium]|nr:hypothetical protein [Paludibacteraceae bacterium]
AFEPDIGAVLAACILDTKLIKSGSDSLGVILIILDIYLYLSPTLGGEYCSSSALNGVRNAVELAALSSSPELADRNFRAVRSAGYVES